ncbi:MAG: hypothetical protein R6V58_12900, partial [Planctomycetota bacterium]
MDTHHFTATVHTLAAGASVKGDIEHYDGRPRIMIEETVRTSASAESHAAQPVAGINERKVTLIPIGVPVEWPSK